MGIAVSLLFAACGKQEAPVTTGVQGQANAAQPAMSAAEVEELQAENRKLRAEITTLRDQVHELSLTPDVLLTRVNDALAVDRVDEAGQAREALNKRFAGSAQTKAANAALAKYDAVVAQRAARAKALEARGFYALQPEKAPVVGGVTVRVESLQMGGRWQFDTHGDEWHYRDAERGERFVLMRTAIHSADKSPNLPDVGVYLIDGKKMTRIAEMRYEFRRWSSYGTFIGLHHDFKNDFAHTSTVPFNAAASISVANASQPFAVVVTGELCHERSSVIGQPDVAYKFRHSCSSKAELDVDDFANGSYRVLAFFNRPKGQ